MPAHIFEPFDRVFAGHYHNRTKVAGTRIEYIGSSRQFNFGENEEKGYTILCADGSAEFVRNRVNQRYRTLDVTAAEVDIPLFDRIDELRDEGRCRIRVRVAASATDTVDKRRLLEAGAGKVEVRCTRCPAGAGSRRGRAGKIRQRAPAPCLRGVLRRAQHRPKPRNVLPEKNRLAMWYLEHVSARNICSFRELEYSPARGTTTLVFGRNADNDNQRSNGSGKSTLVEAIAFGITGAPLRRVRSEEIINDSADSCRVALRFGNTATGEGLLVERGIFRKGTSSVRCLAGMAGMLEEVALESVDAANRYILERLGVSRDELFSAFILSRHRYEDFLSSSDREKKEIINRFSGGSVVAQGHRTGRGGRLAPLGEALHEADLELASLDGRIGMLSEQNPH